MKIDATPDAVAHITARGGQLYVWSTADGLTRTSTERPAEPLGFASYRAESFVVGGPLRPKVKAYWNSRIPRGQIGSGYRLWREVLKRSN